MSHSLSSVSLKDVSTIVNAEPYKLPAPVKIISLIFVGVGFGLFIKEAFMGGDVKNAWASFHVNIAYWFCLAIASSGFSAVFHICNAQWSRPVRRIFEAASNFAFVPPVLLLVEYLAKGYNHLFVWAHEDMPGKADWLKPNFVYGRDILAMLVLAVFAKIIVKMSVQRDLVAIKDGLTGADSALIEKWNSKCCCNTSCKMTPGLTGKEAIARLTHLMWRLSPAFVIFYAVLMSFFAFDQIMSVDPHWFSTMFGGFIFMGAVYITFAWAAMMIYLVRATHPLFKAKIEKRTLHDVGKLLFGFGIFWAYLFWSQYLPIWYANMPEETGYLILRLREQPWHDFAWTVLGGCFFIPFLLGISRDVKQIPFLLFLTGAIVAVSMWLQHYILLVPSLYPHEIPLSWKDLLISLGFMGAYILNFGCFLSRVPLMPFGDLYTEESHH